jgi:glycosyltransferase involved in cell wall biosynthesis
MSERRLIFVNRFFFPDHSATAQLLTDLAFHIAGKHHPVVVITSRGLYDDPTAQLPTRETVDGVEIHRVYRPRFGRQALVGRALDYLMMYVWFAHAVLRLSTAQDVVIAKTDPPLLSIILLPVAWWKGVKVANWLQDLYPEVAVEFGIKSIAYISILLRPLRDLSLRCAQRNVVIGDRMKMRLIDAGVKSERISVVANWSDDTE